MKKFLATTLTAIVLGAGAAQAQDRNDQDSNLSFSVLGGWTSHPGLLLGGTKTSLEDGYNLGARLGAGLDGMGLPGFSLDADYFYNRANYDGSSHAHLASSSFMGDLIYTIPTNSPLRFYGGAGIGAVQDNLDGGLHGSSTVLGWQAIGGTEYALSPNTSLFAEYRYQNAHDANIGAIRNVGNTTNNVSVGVKFGL
jgi:opacity protein-like surface antigen